MKLLSIFLGVLLSTINLSAQGIEFFEGTFEEALEIAKQQEKLIFVDCYTTWCGPCKRMKKYIFPNKKAGDFYNKNFINMAIDMESQMGKAFNMKYPVRAYPTLLFIDGEGNLVKTDIGGKPMELFIQMGETALKLDDRTETYEKEYEAGNRDFKFMLKFVKALNRADKPSTKIVYDYLNNGPAMTKENKARFIFEATSSSDSRLFEMMTEKQTQKIIIKLYSQNTFEDKIYEACWTTVKKGMEYNVSELYADAKNSYKKSLRKKYPKFESEVDMAVAKRNLDASSYLNSAKVYVKLIKNDSNKINELAIEMRDHFLKDEDIAAFAEKISREALKKEDSIENNMNYAKILLKNKKYSEGLIYLEMAITKSKNENIEDHLQDLTQLKRMAESMLKR